MKGSAKVIEALSAVLKAELGAVNQYFLHAEMQENWGYKKLSEATRRESIEEMKHAEELIHRILYFDGTPNMTDYPKLRIGSTVPSQLASDLKLEYDAVKRLNEAIRLCRDEADNGTEDMLTKILGEEERHIDFLESQLELIKQMGLENYLAVQAG